MILFIYGAGGHSKVIAESAIELSNVTKIFFIDDNDKNQGFINNNPDFSLISETEIPNNLDDAYAIVGIGDNKVRQTIVERCSSIPYISVASPHAVISGSSEISPGSFIASGAIINADSLIGEHTIINTGSVIEHDCRIGKFCHIGPSASISGGVKLGSNILIGGGAYINPNISICNNVILGSGSLVVHDINEPGTYIGSPAKKIK